MSPEGAASPDPAPGLPPRYEVRSFLGKGAMGRVYLCRDTELDVVVAVKVLAPHLAADPAAVEAVRSEARAVAKFRGCPSILSLYGFEQHEGSWYLVMEYAAGGSLDDKLKREGRFPEAECRRLGAEVAEALYFAHRHRVLHRDIKPANILLDAGGLAKVADFGIAKVLRGEQESTSTLSISGTPVYIPPEAILRGPLDARSDIYSLGCMLYEMATGKRPFAGNPVEIFMLKMGDQGSLPDVRALVPELSPEYAAIVARAAAPSPGDRFADGAALAAALRAGAPPEASADTPTLTRAVAGGGDLPTIKNAPAAPAAAPAAAQAPAPPPGRSKAPLVAAAAVLVAAGAGWAIFGRGEKLPIAPERPKDERSKVTPVASDPPIAPTDVPKSADPKPVELKPADAKPADAKPADAKPADAKPADAKPADAKPADAKPADPISPEPKPVDPKPPEPKIPPVPPPFVFAVKDLPRPKAAPPADLRLPGGFAVIDGRIASQKDRSEMALVPAGTFDMGSADGDKDEKPVHRVTLKAYLIDRHEVTVAQYRAWCRKANLNLPAQVGPDDGPVVGITWEEADAYARGMGKRLPTEAEWERAARGTDGRNYPWGNEKDKYACNSDGDGGDTPDIASVASKKKDLSPADCFDMGGNAQEWCSDWYGEKWYESLADFVNPQGPLDGERRVVRGGGANADLSRARTWVRSNCFPDILKPHYRIGLRCVADLPD